jgi:hypothetical protein
MQKSEEIEEEDRVHAMAAHAESVFHECEAGEATSYPPALQVEENVLTPNNIVKQTSEPQVSKFL